MYQYILIEYLSDFILFKFSIEFKEFFSQKIFQNEISQKDGVNKLFVKYS